MPNLLTIDEIKKRSISILQNGNNFHAADLYNAIHKSTRDDIQRSYLFKVTFPGNAEFITYFVANTGLPTESSEERKIKWLSSSISVAGETSFQNWTVSVRDNNKGNVYKYFYEWKEMVYHKGKFGDLGTSGLPSEYKKTIWLDMLDTDQTPIHSYIMRGVYPLSIGSGSLDYDNDSIHMFPVTFGIDDFVWVQNSTPTGGIPKI